MGLACWLTDYDYRPQKTATGINMRSKKYNLEQKIEFASCFFCDKTILARNLTIEEIKKYSRSLSDIIGDYTKLKPNKIGKRLICNSCRDDIWGLVQEEDY